MQEINLQAGSNSVHIEGLILQPLLSQFLHLTQVQVQGKPHYCRDCRSRAFKEGLDCKGLSRSAFLTTWSRL